MRLHRWVSMEAITMTRIPCECHDAGCSAHAGIHFCTEPRTVTLYRVDMDDETGTPMCDGCAGDACDSGLFSIGEDAFDDEGQS
jgi:hypothetical protein